MAKEFLTPVQTDANHRQACVTADDCAFNWRSKWGWIMQEYARLSKETAAVQQVPKKVVAVREVDPRDPRPFPITTTQDYGWLGTRQEFTLQNYGPDVLPKSPMLPTNYLDSDEECHGNNSLPEIMEYSALEPKRPKL